MYNTYRRQARQPEASKIMNSADGRPPDSLIALHETNKAPPNSCMVPIVGFAVAPNHTFLQDLPLANYLTT